MEIVLEECNPTYQRYKIKSKNASGKLVVERTTDKEWHIEVMEVYPERQGYGSILLNHVLSELRKSGTKKVTVHPISEASIRFFAKHDFSPNIQHNHTFPRQVYLHHQIF